MPGSALYFGHIPPEKRTLSHWNCVRWPAHPTTANLPGGRDRRGMHRRMPSKTEEQQLHDDVPFKESRQPLVAARSAYSAGSKHEGAHLLQAIDRVVHPNKFGAYEQRRACGSDAAAAL